jgi:DNA-binding response OmpR family regulator
MPTAELTGTSVLIVEDEALLRKQIAGALDRFGADVSQAGDLATARRMITDLNFDFARAKAVSPLRSATALHVSPDSRRRGFPNSRSFVKIA